MTEKELDKLDNKETIAMLKEIDENYSSLDLPIVEPKYNKNGELTNEKEVKKSLKLILPILLVLWERNIAITTAKSIKVMTNTNLYVNTLKAALEYLVGISSTIPSNGAYFGLSKLNTLCS